jgi:hypothetical protein
MINDRKEPDNTQSLQPVNYPRINAPGVTLTAQEKSLLQRLYHPGYEQVLVERDFSSGYSGARVLLTLPVTAGGLRAAHKVTKLDFALALRREQENFAQRVGDFLPFCAARVEKYYEQGERAALNYVFVGGGVLGQVLELEEYYRQHTAEQVIETLKVLLERELGQRWYGQSTPLNCFFADEYGRRLVEHLRLELRPASNDALWPVGKPPAVLPDYQPIPVDAIFNQYATLHTGRLLSVEDLVVTQIKRDEVRLREPDGQGAVVRVKFASPSKVPPGLEKGSHVGVRGQVVHNRRGRMEQIVRQVFPALSSGTGDESIQLPGVPGTYPNPLSIYPAILNRTLRGRQSYVHGDLHLRNVLVDEGGRGWLIDFAHVAKRHNLFDFIKLETYVRLMGLAGGEVTFSHGEFAQFEAALADATLQKASGATYPSNSLLAHAYDVILAIRQMAQNYVGPASSLESEYIPALFLYCLAMLKYHDEKSALSTRLIFITACVLGRYILGQVQDAPEPAATGQRPGTGGRRGTAVPVEVTASTWDPATLRQLLTAAFNDEGLTTLCFDHFRPVYDEFSAGMGKGQKIQRLLDYCERYAQLETLLALVKRQNPAQYARFSGQR